MLNIGAPLPQIRQPRRAAAFPKPYMRSPARVEREPPEISQKEAQPVIKFDVKSPYRNPNKIIKPKPAPIAPSQVRDQPDHIRGNIKKIKHLEEATSSKRRKLLQDAEIQEMTDFRADELRLADSIKKEMQIMLAQQEREYEAAMRIARKTALPGTIGLESGVRLNILQIEEAKITARVAETLQAKKEYYKFVQLLLRTINSFVSRTIIYDMTYLAMDSKQYILNTNVALMAKVLAYNPLERKNRYISVEYAEILIVCETDNNKYARSIVRRLPKLAAGKAKNTVSLLTADCLLNILNKNPFVKDALQQEHSVRVPVAFALLTVQMRFQDSNRTTLRAMIRNITEEGEISTGGLEHICGLIESSIIITDQIFARKNIKIELKMAVRHLNDTGSALSISEALVYLAQDSRKTILQSVFDNICTLVSHNPVLQLWNTSSCK